MSADTVLRRPDIWERLKKLRNAGPPGGDSFRIASTEDKARINAALAEIRTLSYERLTDNNVVDEWKHSERKPIEIRSSNI